VGSLVCYKISMLECIYLCIDQRVACFLLKLTELRSSWHEATVRVVGICCSMPPRCCWESCVALLP
jgi:hypothetical protein